MSGRTNGVARKYYDWDGPGDDVPAYFPIHNWADRWYNALLALPQWQKAMRTAIYPRTLYLTSFALSEEGAVATVLGRGNELIQAQLSFTHFPEQVWERLVDALAAEARHGIALHEHRIPEGLQEGLAATGPSLLPTTDGEVHAACSIDPPPMPCTHVLALTQAVYQQLYANPLLLLTLRGRTAERVLEDLRRRRAGGDDAPVEEEEQDANAGDGLFDGDIDAFWRIGDQAERVAIRFEPPVEHALPVKQLKAVPYGYTRKEFTKLMEQVYQSISAHALRLSLVDLQREASSSQGSE